MSRSVLVLSLLLVASVAANVYFVVARDASPENAATAVTARPRRAAMPPPAASVRAPAAVPASFSSLERAELEQRLADVEARIDSLLPPNERFDVHARSPANEDVVRPFLDKVFGTKAGAPPAYEVECHDVVCRVTSDDPMDWTMRLQTDLDGAGMFTSMMFGQGDAHLVLGDQARAAGIQFMVKTATAIQSSDEMQACKEAHATATGEVMLQLVFDATARRLTIQAFGALAREPIGRCVLRAAEDLVAKVAVPAAVQRADSLPFPIPLPSP